jgi:hypothetical protein
MQGKISIALRKFESVFLQFSQLPTRPNMNTSLPMRCRDLLSEYKFMVDSYLTLRQAGEKPEGIKDLSSAIKRMRKEYLIKCPLPEMGLPKLF